MAGRLTKAQRAWLERLVAEGPTKRSKSNTGYHCMRAGWTHWMAKMPDGKLMHLDDARAALGPDYHDRVVFLDAINERGRLALSEGKEAGNGR